MNKHVIIFLVLLSVGVMFVNYKNEDSCSTLVGKVLSKEPGVDHVENLKLVSTSAPSLLILPGKVNLTCSGDVTFTDGTKSGSKFFRSISENGEEVVYFEPEIIVERFRKAFEEEMDESISI